MYILSTIFNLSIFLYFFSTRIDCIYYGFLLTGATGALIL